LESVAVRFMGVTWTAGVPANGFQGGVRTVSDKIATSLWVEAGFTG
jgi:hypothetical protein